MTTTPSLEKQLGRSFDALVQQYGSSISFAEEAKLVAAFTRNYVQNLFRLSHNDFNSLMKQHRELHAKAELAERTGRDPLAVLRNHIQKGGEFGNILKKYSTHLGALDCILDVKATSALVHHIQRFAPADGLPETVTGCEMGAGTGILTFAGIIPFLAKGIRIVMHSFEQSPVSVNDAIHIGRILKTESRYGELFHTTFHLGDITNDLPYQKVVDTAAAEGPIALWISETFGYRTKKPVIKEKIIVRFDEPAGTAAYTATEEKAYDPLPLVLALSCRHFQGFLEKTQTGLISAFPDLLTPKVIIDGTNSSLLAADGTWYKLHEIGAPYTMLPPCVPSRWNIGTKTQDSFEANAVRKSKRKKKKKHSSLR